MINDKYKVLKKLGQGRSSVYLCEDKDAFNKKVAVKILSPDTPDEEIKSFNDELILLRRLEHPDIIKVLDSGTVLEIADDDLDIERGNPFFVLEYYRGKDAASLNGCSESNLIKFIQKVCGALFYIHQSKIVFYDLKAENILVDIFSDEVNIKLIDFGLAQYNLEVPDNYVRGSAEYIAPELLKKERHDYKIDLYSFGILLYKIVYGNFPFKSVDELDIYKQHLEMTFEFPLHKYSDIISRILKKLLEKEPVNRYQNCIDLLFDIDKSLVEPLVSSWIPARIFSNRNDVLGILNKYINDNNSTEIFIVKGSEGAGKSSLLLKISQLYNNSLYINYDKSVSGINFIRLFLKSLLFNQAIYYKLNPFDIERIKRIYFNTPENLIDEIKGIISSISSEVDLLFLIDNLDEADEYTVDIFRNIIPILQVNKSKVIISENSDKEAAVLNLYNLRDINLTPFTEAHLIEYLKLSYADFFPTESLKKLILYYSDLLPGNFINFIKDILLLNFIKYSPASIEIMADSKSAEILLGTHDDIYSLRISILNEIELKAARIISSVDVPLDLNILSVLLDDKQINIRKLAASLQGKNIIQPIFNNFIFISSQGLKKYIYENIPNSRYLHSYISALINKKIEGFNNVELSRQYELSGDYETAFECLWEEALEAIKTSALSYAKIILSKVITFQLSEEIVYRAKKELTFVLFNLSSFEEAILLIDEILPLNISDKYELNILKASCLVEKGDYEAGKVILNLFVPSLDGENKTGKILTELAAAEYSLNNYKEASELCNKIINNPDAENADVAKSHNLLGLISILRDNDIKAALEHFEIAEKMYIDINSAYKAAQMEMNIGNVYNMKGEHDQAELFWNKSLKIYTSTGNIELEAKLLLNYGIYYFDKLKFDEAVQYYNRALSIFMSLGNIAGQGLVSYNLAEVYINTCEYDKAVDSLNSSIQIFHKLKNINEELESLYLLGKTYFIVGDLDQLSLIIDIVKSKVYDERVIEKNKFNYTLLQQLILILAGNNDTVINTLKELRISYLEQNDSNNFIFISFLLIRLYIEQLKFSEASEILAGEKIKELSESNIITNIECSYWNGIINLSFQSSDIPAFEHFLSAADYLINSSVIEMTWKVFYSLAELYNSRGNTSKSLEYFSYAKTVLEFIYNSSTGSIRSALEKSEDRKKAYEKILQIEHD